MEEPNRRPSRPHTSSTVTVPDVVADQPASIGLTLDDPETLSGISDRLASSRWCQSPAVAIVSDRQVPLDRVIRQADLQLLHGEVVEESLKPGTDLLRPNDPLMVGRNDDSRVGIRGKLFLDALLQDRVDVLISDLLELIEGATGLGWLAREHGEEQGNSQKEEALHGNPQFG